jgi:hypothetical protein
VYSSEQSSRLFVKRHELLTVTVLHRGLHLIVRYSAITYVQIGPYPPIYYLHVCFYVYVYVSSLAYTYLYTIYMYVFMCIMFLLRPIPIHIIIISMVLSLRPTESSSMSSCFGCLYVYIFILWLLPIHLVFFRVFVSQVFLHVYLCICVVPSN